MTNYLIVASLVLFALGAFMAGYCLGRADGRPETGERKAGDA